MILYKNIPEISEIQGRRNKTRRSFFGRVYTKKHVLDQKEKVVKNNDLEDAKKVVPSLNKLEASATLGEYYKKMTENVKPLNLKDVDQKTMLWAVAVETRRLYGSKRRAAVAATLLKFPVVESGVHNSFLRDIGNPGKGLDSLDPWFNQSVYISAVLGSIPGGGYGEHISLQSSMVSMNNENSAGYYQIGEVIFPVGSQKTVGLVGYKFKGVEPDIVDIATKIAKLFRLRANLDTSKYSTVMQKITSLLAPVDSGGINAETMAKVKKNYENSSQKNLDALDMVMAEAIDTDDIDREAALLKQSFEATDVLDDQAALHQSALVSDVLKNVNHTSVEVTRVVNNFLVKSLKKQNSFMYRVFSDTDKLKKFCNDLAGVRAGWGEGESPFNKLVQTSKGLRMESLRLDEFPHTIKEITARIKDGKIVPSTIMTMVSCLIAGVLSHGQFFQSSYAPDIQSRLVKFMREIGEPSDRINRVGGQNTDLNLAVVALRDNDGVPLRPSQIAKLGPEEFAKIPMLPGKDVVKNTATPLMQCLESTDSEFIKSQLARNALAQQHQLQTQFCRDANAKSA